jgi:ferritin-like metal-binding protein YciE
LQTGNETAEQWAQRIAQALQETGSAEDTGNPVLEAHYEVSKKIRQKAADDMSRDLGIIAAGQLALHYWIASFGTLGNYAAKLGLSQTEQSMRTSLEEAKQADQQHTALAEKILGANG